MTSQALFRKHTAQASPSAAVFRESTLPRLVACAVLLPLLAAPSSARASKLISSEGSTQYLSGKSVGLSGETAVVGDIDANKVLLYRELSTATGTITQNATLSPSDGRSTDHFGKTVTISGSNAVAWGLSDREGERWAYFYRGLDTASGNVTETAKLKASQGAQTSYFDGMSLSGNSALLGDSRANLFGGAVGEGAAYLFRNLDIAQGTVTETATLKAAMEDGDRFGAAVSLSGATAVVLAGEASDQLPSTYLFRNLDTATGVVTESAELIASDRRKYDDLDGSVSVSGSIAITGAYRANSGYGAAYLFRNLDTATGIINENAKLATSDTDLRGGLGFSVSVSGTDGLVGARYRDSSRGAAYLYRNLDTATGTVTENVRLTASDGIPSVGFGGSISLDGDLFVIGDGRGAYSGRVSAFTTLDEGNAARATDRLSFVSQDDWVIGQGTAGNQLTLTAGDTGTVSAAGKAVYVGRAAGADRNRLSVAGNLTANAVRVGAAGNTGNSLRISGMITTSGGVTVASGSSIGGDGVLTGDLTLESGAFWEFATSSPLTVTGKVSMDRSFGVASLIGLGSGTANGEYTLIESPSTDFVALGIANWGESNAYDLGGGKSAWFERGSLRLVVVPEPTAGLLSLLAGAVGALTRRRSRCCC